MSKLAPFRGKTTPRNQPMQTGRITHQNPTKGRRLSTKRNNPHSCQKKDEINVKKGQKQGQKRAQKTLPTAPIGRPIQAPIFWPLTDHREPVFDGKFRILNPKF